MHDAFLYLNNVHVLHAGKFEVIHSENFLVSNLYIATCTQTL